jgi:formate hydrogenlyase subunit 3/multisubunit Na+/H+ antiporter MnhD subunit
MTQIAIEAAGWIGGGLILIGYWLVSSGRVKGRSRSCQFLNLVGSLGFVANAAWHGAIPPMTLNIIWCIISLYTLATLRKERSVE